MVIFGMLGGIMFIPLFFLLSIFLAFTIRKRIIEKIIFIEIDENLKDLAPKEFFYNILKMEKSAKPIYYTEIFLLLILSILIIFQGYKEYPNFFPMGILSFELTLLGVLWLLVLLLFVFALIMKNVENKRIAEMLSNLDKYKLLNYAKEDFINSDRIVGTGMMGQSDIKLGNKYFFSIYPAYIVPYSWIDDVKVKKFSAYRGGAGTRYYLDFTFKKSFKLIQIFFTKKEIAEKIVKFILKNK